MIRNENTLFSLFPVGNENVDPLKIREVFYYLNSCISLLRRNLDRDPLLIPEASLTPQMGRKILEVCEIVAGLANDEPKKVFYELLYGAHYAMKNSNDGKRFAKIKNYFREDLCPEISRAFERELEKADEVRMNSIVN